MISFGGIPRRLATSPTHNVSAAGVGCCGGDRRQPANTANLYGWRPSPFAPLPRTWPPLKKPALHPLSLGPFCIFAAERRCFIYEYRRERSQGRASKQVGKMVPNPYRNLAIWQGDLVKDVATTRLTLAIFASLAKNRASPSLIGGVFLWVGDGRFGAI